MDVKGVLDSLKKPEGIELLRLCAWCPEGSSGLTFTGGIESLPRIQHIMPARFGFPSQAKSGAIAPVVYGDQVSRAHKGCGWRDAKGSLHSG